MLSRSVLVFPFSESQPWSLERGFAFDSHIAHVSLCEQSFVFSQLDFGLFEDGA